MAHGHSPSLVNWNAEVASEVVARWEASGLSGRAFCAAHGVEVKRLYRWRQRLRPRVQSSSPAATAGFAVAIASPGVRVRLPGGAAIEVDPGFDAGLLRQVVVALS